MLLMFALALAADTVEVPGVGPVPIADALATCRDGQSVGVLVEANIDRTAAFTTVVENLLAADEATRLAYFGLEAPWPTRAIDGSYAGSELPWEPPGVTTSCTAAGMEMVRRGIELREACDQGKAACRDAFPASDQVALRQALKSVKPSGRLDGFLAEVGRADIASWASPRPLLEKACAAPMQAGTAMRFIDTHDLQAARLACVQLLTLIEGSVPELTSRLSCATPWRATAGVAAIESPTDLGVTGNHVEVQVTEILDKLDRSDPSAATCDTPWGSAWRGHRQLWLDRQQARACSDDALPLPDRIHLCPDLLQQAEAACRASDLDQCALKARLHLEGVGTPQDTRAALDGWREACHAAHSPSCEAIAGHADQVQAWLDEALALAGSGEVPEGATPSQDALDMIIGFGDALGPEWVKEQALRLFEVAMEAEAAKVASDVLALHGTMLGLEWSDVANLRLQKLEEKLGKGG